MNKNMFNLHPEECEFKLNNHKKNFKYSAFDVQKKPL